MENKMTFKQQFTLQYLKPNGKTFQPDVWFDTYEDAEKHGRKILELKWARRDLKFKVEKYTFNDGEHNEQID